LLFLEIAPAVTGMKIRTLIVDDEPLARERIRTLLEEEPDIELIANAIMA